MRRARLLILWPVTLLLLILGIGCASGQQATPTPRPLPTVAGNQAGPVIAFDKLGVDLGTLAQDSEAVQTFLVLNKGDSLLQVEPIKIEALQGGDPFKTVTGSTSVKPGNIVGLPVTIGPHQDLGPHRLLVSVESNDRDRPVATVSKQFTVMGQPPAPGPGPRLRVDKETIDIGVVPYDWPLYERFTLRNDGDAPLVLEGEPMVRVEAGC